MRVRDLMIVILVAAVVIVVMMMMLLMMMWRLVAIGPETRLPLVTQWRTGGTTAPTRAAAVAAVAQATDARRSHGRTHAPVHAVRFPRTFFFGNEFNINYLTTLRFFRTLIFIEKVSEKSLKIQIYTPISAKFTKFVSI